MIVKTKDDFRLTSKSHLLSSAENKTLSGPTLDQSRQSSLAIPGHWTVMKGTYMRFNRWVLDVNRGIWKERGKNKGRRNAISECIISLCGRRTECLNCDYD